MPDKPDPLARRDPQVEALDHAGLAAIGEAYPLEPDLAARHAQRRRTRRIGGGRAWVSSSRAGCAGSSRATKIATCSSFEMSTAGLMTARSVRSSRSSTSTCPT
jgi:hypothetical protein